MGTGKGYRVEPFGGSRQMVAAASAVSRENDTIHLITKASRHLGSATGMAWIRYIPGFLLRPFVRWAARNIAMQKRFGVVGVTAVGMFGAGGSMWLVPLTNATVTVAVGSISKRLALSNGDLQEREQLCLTLSFDHDLVDGAPAARFTSRFAALLASGDELCDMVNAEVATPGKMEEMIR